MEESRSGFHNWILGPGLKHPGHGLTSCIGICTLMGLMTTSVIYDIIL